jgi:MFS family permease
MVGIATGGIVAHHFGYRIPCFVAGGFQVISFVLVLAGTKELRRPAEHDRQTAVEENGFPLAGLLRTTLPILVVMAAIVTLRRFDDAFIPLFIQELRAGRDDAALWTGWTGAMGALAGLTAGVVLGRMSDRISPRRMVVTVCLGSAVLLYSHSLLHGIGWLIAVRAVYTFGAGGLDTLIHIWLAKTTPEERRGIAFGWAGSARAVGMMLGPLAGGAVATGLGLRPLFIVGAMLYACMAATFLLWPTNLVPKKSGGTQPI